MKSIFTIQLFSGNYELKQSENRLSKLPKLHFR